MEAFFICIHQQTGVYQHLPFEGSVMDQPYKTMKIFSIWKGIFHKEIEKQNKGNK
ncbi:MAG: hypothetical protein ACTSVR_01265 [Candidatus Thorarchaeota archaeon]